MSENADDTLRMGSDQLMLEAIAIGKDECRRVTFSIVVSWPIFNWSSSRRFWPVRTKMSFFSQERRVFCVEHLFAVIVSSVN